MESLWEWVAGVVVMLWLGLMSWLGKRQVDRIDDLYSSKAGRASTDKRFDDLVKRLDEHMAEDRRMHDAVIAKHSQLVDKHSETNEKLAEIVGELRSRR